MALTKEQFDRLRQEGLSVQQIIEFEKGNKPDTRSGLRKGFDFVTQSEQRFGETLGDVVAVNTKDYKGAMESQAGLDDKLVQLGRKIAEMKKDGRDTSTLERTYQNLSGSRFNAGEIAPSINKAPRQIVGEGLGVATDILGAGSLERKGAQVLGSGAGLMSGIGRGAVEAGKAGALFGGADSAFRAMQDDAEVMDIAKSGLSGALVGGVAGGVLGGATGGLGGAFTARQLRRADLERMVKQGETGGVKFKVDDPSKVAPALKKDETAVRAINKGIDPRQVNMIKGASDQDKIFFREMVDLAEKASDDMSVVARPIDVTGNAILNRAKYLRNAKQSLGRKLDTSIKNLPDELVSLNNVYTDYVDNLANNGVRVRANGTLDFRNSIWRNSASAQKEISEIYSDIRPNSVGEVLRKPNRVVDIRRRIFEDLSAGQKKGEVTNTLENLIADTRKSLLEELGNISPEFRLANEQYAKSRAGINKFNQLMGKGFDIESDLANIRAGEISRRLMGNAKYKPYSTMKEIEDLAVELGYKKKDDIIRQAQFAQLLEDIYDLTPQTSLQGQVSRGVDDAMDGIGMASDIARKDLIGFFQKGYKKIKGVTPEAQRAVIKELIK